MNEHRIRQLQDFHPGDGALSPDGCGELSASSRSVQLDASASALQRVFQTSTTLTAEDIHLVVRFGSDLPGFTCTDLPSEVRTAVVDETWSATASGGTFTVIPTERCAIATLEVFDVIAVGPQGESVPMGDFIMRNDEWNWWPPFECYVKS